MNKFISVLLLSMLSFAVYADQSDYIWNQQFEKKIVLAESGNIKAQYDIGNMYLKGQGIAKDAGEAFKWFEKAAAKQYARAEYKLGYLYHRGDGVTKSNKQAARWISKAAKKNYKPAMYYLGKLYTSGDGVQASLDTALTWQKKALAAGYNPARREIERLEDKIEARRREAKPEPRPVRVVEKKKKAKPQPQPVKVAKRVTQPREKTYSENELRNLLTSNAWYSGGKPAELLPSELTSCKQDGERLVCESKELEIDESYGVVSYKMKVVINDFNRLGEFNTEYQKDVTLIFPNDPDDPDLLIPIEYGLQKRQLMRCKATDARLVCYRGDKREKVAYEKR